jgi:hypothetical protein
MQAGTTTFWIRHLPPKLAERWTRALIEKINRQIQDRDISESEKKVAFLKQQIEYTSIATMQRVFYQLLKSQTIMLMLAKGSGEYALKTISPAREAEVRYKPKRAVICVLGTMAGFLLSVLFVLVQAFARKNQ